VKRVFLTSLLVALVFGSLTAFVDSIAWVRVSHRYEPPLSELEMRQWDKGSVTQLRAELEKRQVPYSRAQWLADSIRQRFFWTGLAKRSLVTILGIFFACVCVIWLNRRVSEATTTGRNLSATPS
jgi:hypothetical protein